jgi:hypothetical protein
MSAPTRRLCGVHRHLCSYPADAAAVDPAELPHAHVLSRSSQPGRHTEEAPQLFDDDQMRAFIREGYVLLKPGLPEGYNEMICEKADRLLEQGRDMGNNMVPQMPELMTMFDSPQIHGALTSILGQDYYIHLHRHAHTSRGIDKGAGQRMHKDSVGNSRHCVDSKRRHHRTRWCMLLYFPQDTPVELGPTAIMPESQYMLRYDMREHGMDDVQLDGELPCAGPAGTVCIIHYDTLHRKMAQRLEGTRHMLKFIVCRMSEPLAPSWDHDPAAAAWPESDHSQSLIHEAVWRWHLGSAACMPPPPVTTDIATLSEGLRSEDDELVAVNAAYTLALLGGVEAADALIATLSETTPPQKDWSGNGNGGTDPATSAGYGLVNMRGAAALGALRTLLSNGNCHLAEVRARAIDALADMGLTAQRALPELLEQLEDGADDVRRRAAEVRTLHTCSHIPSDLPRCQSPAAI